MARRKDLIGDEEVRHSNGPSYEVLYAGTGKTSGISSIGPTIYLRNDDRTSDSLGPYIDDGGSVKTMEVRHSGRKPDCF